MAEALVKAIEVRVAQGDTLHPQKRVYLADGRVIPWADVAQPLPVVLKLCKAAQYERRAVVADELWVTYQFRVPVKPVIALPAPKAECRALVVVDTPAPAEQPVCGLCHKTLDRCACPWGLVDEPIWVEEAGTWFTKAQHNSYQLANFKHEATLARSRQKVFGPSVTCTHHWPKPRPGYGIFYVQEG